MIKKSLQVNTSLSHLDAVRFFFFESRTLRKWVLQSVSAEGQPDRRWFHKGLCYSRWLHLWKLLMVIAGFHLGWCEQTLSTMGNLNYQPQLFFTPDFWTINSMVSEIRGSWWFQFYMVLKRWWSLKNFNKLPCYALLSFGASTVAGRPWHLFFIDIWAMLLFLWLATLLHNVALEWWVLSNFETSLVYHYSDSSFPKKNM